MMNIIGIDSAGQILLAQTNAPADAATALQQNSHISQVESVSDSEVALALTAVGTPDAYWNGTQVVASPPSPGTAYTWDWPSHAWVLNLTAGQTAAWARIKAARDAALSSPFEWNGLMFDGDDKAQARIQGAGQLAQLALQAGQPFEVTWTLADNTSRTLSAQEIMSVGVTMGARYQAVFARGRALRDQIDAATTQAELDAVIW